MPTRKQRRRAQKERRHEYETVWVDDEGNEVDDPPEDLIAAAPEKRANGKPRAKAQPQRGGRPARVPQPPSWRRAGRRSLILGGAIFALFFVLGSKNGGHNAGTALGLAALYTALFIPFTYFIDRFAYNRFLRREEQSGSKGSARKR
jgi:hypothetical protein